MNVSELTRRRNFATFELGDNVTQLSERLLSDLAAVGGVSIRGCHEDPMCLSTLATAIDELSEDGTCEIEALPLLQATAYVQRSGIMGLKNLEVCRLRLPQ